MRIDMGNFGNAQRQVVDTRIDRGNPAEMAEAKLGVAQQKNQANQMAAQAWDRVGQQMQQIGGQMLQEQQQLAQQKAGLVIQQKQIFAQGVAQQAQDLVDSGDLKSSDVKKYFGDAMAGFKYDDIDGLTDTGRLALDKGLQAVDMQTGQLSDHLYRQADKIETRQVVDETVSNTERLALNSGQDLDKAASVYDSPVFQANMRKAYGADAAARTIAAKNSLYHAGAVKAIQDNAESYSGLTAVQKEFQEGGKFYGKLDADTQLQLTGQIATHKSSLEARAAAEAQRRAAAQVVAENKAMAASQNMRDFIMAGNVPDAGAMAKYQQTVKGTSLANSSNDIMQLAVQTQKFGSLPLAQQKTIIDNTAAQMKAGTNPNEVARFKIMQQTYETQRKQLIDDPIVTVATRSGASVPPLPFDVLQNARTPDDQRAANQAFSTVIHERAAITQTARQQSQEVPNVLLTAQERDDMKAYAGKLAPAEQVNFYKTLANAGGSYGVQLVKEISGSDVVAAAAYHQAVDPHGSTATMIVEGNNIINDKKSGYKPPATNKTQPIIDEALGGAVPPAQRSTIGEAINAHYVASRTRRNLDPNEIDDDEYRDSIREVVGDTVEYGSAKVVVPKGTDAGQFRSTVYNQLSAMPSGKNSIALLEAGQAGLKAVGAKSYMLTTPNGGAYFDPQTKQPVKIEIP